MDKSYYRGLFKGCARSREEPIKKKLKSQKVYLKMNFLMAIRFKEIIYFTSIKLSLIIFANGEKNI